MIWMLWVWLTTGRHWAIVGVIISCFILLVMSEYQIYWVSDEDDDNDDLPFGSE